MESAANDIWQVYTETWQKEEKQQSRKEKQHKNYENLSLMAFVSYKNECKNAVYWLSLAVTKMWFDGHIPD